MSELAYLISKAERESAYAYVALVKADGDGYRDSYFERINPRSRTEVREGSMPKRAARYLGGGMVGAGVGQIAGASAGPAGRILGGTIGGAIGSTVGRTYNIRSGDTRARHRRTGRKAKGAVTIPQIGDFWVYGDKK